MLKVNALALSTWFSSMPAVLWESTRTRTMCLEYQWPQGCHTGKGPNLMYFPAYFQKYYSLIKFLMILAFELCHPKSFLMCSKSFWAVFKCDVDNGSPKIACYDDNWSKIEINFWHLYWPKNCCLFVQVSLNGPLGTTPKWYWPFVQETRLLVELVIRKKKQWHTIDII